MKQTKKYLFLMLALITTIFLSTLGQPPANALAAFFFLLSIMVAVYAISQSKLRLLMVLALGLSAIFPLWQVMAPSKLIGELMQILIWISLTFYIGSVIFRDIIRDQPISTNEIYGAISVYFLIGIWFGMIYQMLVLFDPNAFYFNPTNFKNLPPTDGDFFYYSFITLSTVGYGDVSPVAPIARSISMLEAILGVMYVATMIARFIANHSNKDPQIIE